MSHPLLQGADVDSVLEMSGSVCVAKFVKEPAGAVGALSAAIDFTVHLPVCGSRCSARN